MSRSRAVNQLYAKPTYCIHRELSGSPVTADGAITGFLKRAAVNCNMYESIRGFVKLTGGTAPTASLECYEVAEYLDSNDAKQEQWILHGPQISNLADGDSFAVDDCRGRLVLRVAAVSGSPTKVEVYLAGNRPLSQHDGGGSRY